MREVDVGEAGRWRVAYLGIGWITLVSMVLLDEQAAVRICVSGGRA